MKNAVYSFVIITLGMVILAQGCAVIEGYDITVVNDTDSNFSVYLDDALQFKLAAGGSSIIYDVEEGRHILDARDSSGIIAQTTIDVDRDVEWIVYIDTYEITVVNSTGSYFSVFLDGIFQFELDPGHSRTIPGVSEGEHTVDARVGSEIIAGETFYVDSDMEWTVY